MSDDFSQFQLGRKANSTNDFSLSTPETVNAFEQVGNNTLVKNNPLQSPNYVSGQTGYTLNPDGTAEFLNVTVSGTINAGSINIPDTTTTNSFHVDTAGNAWWGANVSSGYSNAPAYVLNSGTAYFTNANVAQSSTVSVPLVKAYTAGETLAAGDAVYPYAAAGTNTHTIDLERDSSQYLYVADTVPLSITGDMSVEMWVYLESAPSSGEIYELASKYEETGNQMSWAFSYQNNGGTPRFIFTSNNTGAAAGSLEGTLNYTISTATWTHLAIVYNAATPNVTFYVNGSSVGTAGARSSLYNSTADFRIGARPTPTIGGYFDGYIDDVRVWNDVRTASEIAFYRNKVLAGTESNLVAYWKLDNSLADSTSNAATLTNSGSAVFQSSSLPFTGGTVYKTDTDITGAYESFIGFAQTAITAGQSGNIIIAGEVTGLSGLTLGSTYYLSGTPGGITTSSAAPARKCGIATSTTSLLITNLW